MSYYSDVMITTDLKGYYIICENVAKACFEANVPSLIWDEADVTINVVYDYVIMFWLRSKWYKDRVDVGVIMETLTESYLGEKYSFPSNYLRFGEADIYDDVESSYNDPDGLIPLPWIDRIMMVEDRDGSTELNEEMLLFITIEQNGVD